MRSVIQGWSGFGICTRLTIVVLTGAAWATSSLVFVILHPEYWDPVAAIDFFAVYAYSTAWLLTTASLLILRDLVRPGRAGSLLLVVVAAACAVAGIANAVEDAFGLKGFGAVYIAGALIGWLGMFVVAAIVWVGVARSLWFVPALGGIAMVGVTTVLGAVALVPWLGLGVIITHERSLPPATPSGT